MRIVITGATGFIGSKLLSVLELEGNDILILSRQTPNDLPDTLTRYVKYNLGEDLPQELIDFAPEILIHLAWEGIPDFSAAMCLKNVNDQIILIQKLKEILSLRKVIVTGSCVEYGTKDGICAETERNQPHSHFSWAKQTLCDSYRLFCTENNINLVWFRLFYVYGAGQRPGSLIPTLISSFQNSRWPDLRNPSMANDYIYIDDVIEAFLRAIKSEDIKGTFNLGSGRLTPVYTISSIIERLVTGANDFSSSLIPQADEIAVNLKGFYADIKSAEHAMGWKPRWSLESGIEQTYRSYTIA